MMEDARISVIIPAKNESVTIKDVIVGVKPYADELIVVDGRSTDTTREVSESMGARVILDHGKGKGDGIRVSIQEATGDVLVFIDADGSHDPNDIPKLVRPIFDEKSDMVIGSRMTGGSDELTGDIGRFIRNTGSHVLLLAVNYRWNVRLTDNQNGFRAIRTDVARDLGLKENIHTIEQEMVLKCLRKGYRISEVPSHEYHRKHGVPTLVVWRVWHRYIWCILRHYFW
jgi:glycosyltransferase involved in cell wall biosynthesis